MANKRKLYPKALNIPKGLRFAELDGLIVALGFERDRQPGSHRIYARVGVREFVNVRP